MDKINKNLYMLEDGNYLRINGIKKTILSKDFKALAVCKFVDKSEREQKC